MKNVTHITLLVLLGLMVQNTFAGSATWNLNPTSDDWNTAANWTPSTVPDDPSDVATFDASNITSVLLQDQVDLAEIIFNPGANGFTINALYPGLNFYGAGITNHSGVVQRLGADLAGSELKFFNSATAGENTILFEAGPRVIDNHVTIEFHDTSSADNATIINSGTEGTNSFGGTYFYDSSTADNATVFNQSNYSNGFTSFQGSSKAGRATFICETGKQNGGELNFHDSSSAENATITINGAPRGLGGGEVSFYDTATADNATFIINGETEGGPGGTLFFFPGSLGGTPRVEVFGNGILNISYLGASDGITIGSLEGDGIVLLGSNRPSLTIGTNDLSTIFSGDIQGTGSVVKKGSGTLIFTRANTYMGVTSVVGGFLKISNRTGSATGSGPVEIFSGGGTLGGSGIIGGTLDVSSGGTLAPGTGTTTLTVKKHVTFDSGSSYGWRIKTTSTQADKVIARGVVISSGVSFSAIGLGSTALPPGTVFTAIDNTSSNAISGTFRKLPDGGTVTIGNNTFQANYEGGDGNDLTLTVVP